jgi:hypothetical protein
MTEQELIDQGVQQERERILNLLKYYWCGEPECKEHTTNWPHLIENVKGNK